MIKLTFPLACLLALSAAQAPAQVRIHIDLGLPPLPHLVVVQPGIQVVEGFGEEVFFHRGWYWCRRPDGWYRARSPRSHFDWVEAHRVPGALVRMPEGHYRNWHHDEARPMERRDERPVRREEMREDGRDRREHDRRDHDHHRDRDDHEHHEH